MAGPPFSKKSLVDYLLWILVLLVGALATSASSDLKDHAKDINQLKANEVGISQQLKDQEKKLDRMENKIDRLMEKGNGR